MNVNIDIGLNTSFNENLTVINKKLIFIGLIQANDKVDTINMAIIKPSFFVTLKRTLTNIAFREDVEGRNKTFAYIAQTHNMALLYLRKMFETDDDVLAEPFMSNIIQNINNSFTGCENLIITYGDDKGFASKMTSHCQNIRILLQQYKKN